MVRAPLRRLMLATEGTPHDAGAERVAVALARALEAALTVLLPFVTNDELLGSEPALALKAEAAAGAALRQLVAGAVRAGVMAEGVVRRGSSIAQEILAAAAADHADLLLTRRVGRRGLLARLLVGEMVSEVAAQSRCPVLMVPETTSALWSGRVLLPESTGDGPESLARTLAGATRVPLERAAGDMTAVVARAHAGDLLVIALGRAEVAAGRLAKALEAVIGAAPCPTLLVPAGNDADQRA